MTLLWKILFSLCKQLKSLETFTFLALTRIKSAIALELPVEAATEDEAASDGSTI